MDWNFWGDAAQSAALFEQEWPEEAKATVALADELCENSFTFRGHWEMERTHVPVHFTGAVDWRHIENGDPEWCYALNRHSFLVTLGRAWRLTGSAAYAQRAAALWADWLAREPLTPESRQTTWRAIEAGLRCESWLRALWLLAGSGVPDAPLLGDIEAALRTHAAYLLESHAPFQRLSNWGVLQDHGLLLLGLALGEQAWCTEAARRLEDELAWQVMADGTHWEQSPLYHCEVLHCCLNAVRCARERGFALPAAFEEKTHAMAKALAALLRPDGLLLCQGDSDEVDARDLLALAAWLFCDSGLKAAAGERLRPENIWDFAGHAAEYAALPTGGRPASRHLPDSGNTMLAIGPGEAAGFLHFSCGCLGSGHGHANLLHIDLVCGGESILCDSGRYTYVDTALRRQLKSAGAHNTVCVDGQDVITPTDSWGAEGLAQPLKGEVRFTPGVDYASGAHLGYLQNGVLHRRHVLRLGRGLWLWWDVFHTKQGEPHTYRHHYHFGPEGRFAPQNNGGIYSGEKASATLAVCGAEVTQALAKAPSSREYNRLEQHDHLTLEHSGQGFASLASAVATGPAGAAPALLIQPLAVTLHPAGDALPAETAQAVQVDCGGESWTVILCHNEPVSGVQAVRANGLCGYGRVLVFAPGETEATVLVW